MIGVALSSRVRDLRTKPTVYAPHVAEYWVVNLERRCLVVHRDAVGGAYQDVTIVPRGETVEPLAVPIAALDTDALFADAFAERT